MSPRSKSARILCALAWTALVLFAAPAGAASPRPLLPKALNSFDSSAVERAREGAARKLQDTECLRVLTDFQDREGRTLDRSLESWGLSAADYVKTLPFRDGGKLPGCERRVALLQTYPGRPPVFVCPTGSGGLNSRFATVQVKDPSLAEAMVIHEMLHTLGLGENPPTSLEITERVRARCR